MKVYLIYLVLRGFDRRFDYLVNQNTIQCAEKDVLISLYGVTSSKLLLKKFLEVRDKQMFRVFHKKMTKEEYRELTSTYPLTIIYETKLCGCEKELTLPVLESILCEDEYESELEAYIQRIVPETSIRLSTDHLIDIETASPWKRNKKRILKGDKGNIFQIITEQYEDDYLDNFERWLKYFSITLDMVEVLKYLNKETEG